MKRSIMCLMLFLLAGIFSTTVIAEDITSRQITVSITGTLYVPTCTIDNKSLEVPMGRHSIMDLNKSGKALPVMFDIKLSNCKDKVTSASVIFSSADSSKEPRDSISLVDSAAQLRKDIDIQLLNSDKQVIMINKDKVTFNINAQEPVISLPFYAQLRKINDGIKEGGFTGTAQFQITYE